MAEDYSGLASGADIDKCYGAKSNIQAQLDDKQGLAVAAYGVRWNASDDTYEQGALIHGYFMPITLVDFPVQEQMKRVVLDDAGDVAYELYPTDSTLQSDGATSSDLTGGDGQVMVQIPAFHYIQHQFTHPLTGKKYRYFLIGTGPFGLILPDGSIVSSAIHPAFYKAGELVDYRYLGAYQGSMYDDSESAMTAVASIHTDMYASGDVLCSVSGQYPKTNETRAEFRAMAEERGTGWQLMDSNIYAAIGLLYLTEYGDLNSQSEIGNGRTGLSGGTWIAGEDDAGGYIGIAGLSNSDGNATANVSNGEDITGSESGDYMSYRGIENFWGNIWQFLDGANVKNSTADGSELYVCDDHTAFDDDTDTDYDLAGNLAEADGYPVDMIDGADGVWPSSVGGSSSTYVPDYFSTYFDTNNDSGWLVVCFGGCATDGANAGVFSIDSSGASTIDEASIGARLCF